MTETVAMTLPQLACRELPMFNVGDLDAVRAAFAPADSCELQQAWRDEPESDFAPATVRVGWRRNSLRLLAELTDADIFSRATGHNQRMWELGDVLEIFLSPEHSASYVKFHVTPANWRLQLRFPNTATLRRAQSENRFEHLLLPDGAFFSRTWVQPENKKWLVHVEIPAAAVGGAVGVQALACPPDTLKRELQLAGTRWRFSFSRYDYVRGRKEPMFSSSSPHAQPDFHRREEWGTLNFV